jgi:hypothetical protein
MRVAGVFIRPTSYSRIVHWTGNLWVITCLLFHFMHYVINLSEESDHFLRQLCDARGNSHGEGVSVEDFLSAFVEEQLDEQFVRRARRKSEKDKKVDDAVRSAKERAKAWSEAVIATHTALEAMRKLVADGATKTKGRS